MFFTKHALGLEICQDEARFVVLEGKQTKPRLGAYVIPNFPADTVRHSTRELNILNPQAFVAAIRESHQRLLTKERRVSVSLPDAIGRVVLLEMETRFKSRDEGADLIRWKLKKSMPIDINDVQLDYQVLREQETGEVLTLVSFISRQVVTQYEELLLEAGLLPNRIDFNAFNRYGLFAERLDLAEYVAVVAYVGRSLSILVFNDGILEFFRTKEISGKALDADRVFREISSSLLVYQEKFPAHKVSKAYFSVVPEDADTMRAVVAEAVGLDPVQLLAERAISLKEGLTVDRNTLQLLASAAGAALRNL
jgi:type IV pilus assembly protein PilM